MAKKQLNRKRLFFALILLALGTVAVLALRTAAGLYEHMHQFSFAVRNQDREAAQKELQILRGYYQSLSGWKLEFLANRLIFKDASVYDAAVAYISEDYEKILKDFEKPDERHLIMHLLGIAKFRILQAEYQSASDEKSRNEIIGLVLKEITPDFDRTVRNGPGPAKAFDYSFNYDLVTNPEAVKRALEKKPAGPKIRLGISPGDSDKPGEPSKKGTLKTPFNKLDGSGHSDSKRKG